MLSQGVKERLPPKHENNKYIDAHEATNKVNDKGHSEATVYKNNSLSRYVKTIKSQENNKINESAVTPAAMILENSTCSLQVNNL